MAKNKIRQIRNVPIFREPDEIFEKFQNWHIGDKKIVGVIFEAFLAKLTLRRVMSLCPENGHFKPL